MPETETISIIMPAYNAEEFIDASINSVLNQDFSNWDLLIINDGSTDQTQSRIDQFSDRRIKSFQQENQGVSAARNHGLNNASGEYICFLDADDILPLKSLSARHKVFKKSSDIVFVDGSVEVYDRHMNKKIREWSPSFEGNPFEDLINLTGKSFFGPTWMIKRNAIGGLQLNESMSHAEDLLFYTELAGKGGLYDYCNEVILHYRSGNQSAMKDLKSLEKGYKKLILEFSKMDSVSENQILILKKKVKYMMAKAYLRDFDLLSAISVYLNK